MLCKICNKNPATIHIQEIVNGDKKMLHICADCAAKKSKEDPILQGFNLAEMLYSLSGQIGSSQEQLEKPASDETGKSQEDAAAAHPSEPACEKCGWDTARFRKTGRLGCSHCYSTFSDLLSPALSNMHRGLLHMGKAPGQSGPARRDAAQRLMELASLQKELDGLVKREEFEKAAQLRDRINKLKAEAETEKAGEGADAEQA